MDEPLPEVVPRGAHLQHDAPSGGVTESAIAGPTQPEPLQHLHGFSRIVLVGDDALLDIAQRTRISRQQALCKFGDGLVHGFERSLGRLAANVKYKRM